MSYQFAHFPWQHFSQFVIVHSFVFSFVVCLLLKLLNLHIRDMIHYVLILNLTIKRQYFFISKLSLEQDVGDKLISVASKYPQYSCSLLLLCFLTILLNISAYLPPFLIGILCLASVALQYDGFLHNILFTLAFSQPSSNVGIPKVFIIAILLSWRQYTEYIDLCYTHWFIEYVVIGNLLCAKHWFKEECIMCLQSSCSPCHWWK